MAEPVRCPDCGRTEHARRHTLYRAERPPWWARLLNRLGRRGPSMVERQVGFVVTCQGPQCSTTYAIGDGGPRDTWRPDAKSLMPPAVRDALAAPPRERPQAPDRDPADDTLMRTLR